MIWDSRGAPRHVRWTCATPNPGILHTARPPRSPCLDDVTGTSRRSFICAIVNRCQHAAASTDAEGFASMVRSNKNLPQRKIARPFFKYFQTFGRSNWFTQDPQNLLLLEHSPSDAGADRARSEPGFVSVPLVEMDQGWGALQTQALAFICVLIDSQTPTPALPTKGDGSQSWFQLESFRSRPLRGLTR